MEIKTIDDYIMREMVMGLSKEDMGLAAQCKTPQEYVVRKLVKAEKDLDDANEKAKYWEERSEIFRRGRDRIVDIYREFMSKKLGITLDEVDYEIRDYLEGLQIKDEIINEDEEEK